MFQVTFSEQSLSALNKLSTPEQLELIAPLSHMTDELLNSPEEPLGKFKRDGHTYYRIRTGDYRIYFERDGSTLRTTCILHRNSLTDFIFRAKLPISDEQLIEQHSSFWKYLETLKR